MIIPTHCKSCGKVIGHLWFPYQEKLQIFRKEDRAEANDADDSPPTSDTPEARALDELLIHRYCCRLMFLCQPEGLVDKFRNRVEN